MENKAALFLAEMKFSTAELSQIDDEVAAFLSVLSLVVNDLNTLKRLYLTSSHDPTGEEAIDTAAVMQRLLLLRTASSKVFEAEAFLAFPKKKPCSIEIREFAENALLKLKKLNVSRGRKVAEYIRHEASNHYSFQAALKNWKMTQPRAESVFYFHQMGGNCRFPIGEDVNFYGRLVRMLSDKDSDDEFAQLLDEWFSWVISANACFDEFHSEFLLNFVLPNFSDKVAKERLWWVDPKFVVGIEDHTAPLFFRTVKANLM